MKYILNNIDKPKSQVPSPNPKSKKSKPRAWTLG